MSDKSRRPWFQIHLSTAVVMMIVSAFMLRANASAQYTLWTTRYGWPFVFYERDKDIHWYVGNLVFDAAFNVASLAAICMALELLTRCRPEHAQ